MTTPARTYTTPGDSIHTRQFRDNFINFMTENYSQGVVLKQAAL